MGALLDRVVSSYYQAHKDDGDLEDDALTAMKAIEQDVVNEVLQEHAEDVVRREASLREERRKKEQEQNLRDSIRSFWRLVVEGVVLATIVGLVGSHLYGLGEAWLYAPMQDFNFVASAVVMGALIAVCVVFLFLVFTRDLPEWVTKAMRRNDEG
jgi:small-conductance mechanosensitive channel